MINVRLQTFALLLFFRGSADFILDYSQTKFHRWDSISFLFFAGQVVETSESSKVNTASDKKDAYKIATDKCAEYSKMKLPCTTEYHTTATGKAFYSRCGPTPYPHMALIGYNENLKNVTWNCGATLISERYLLTAAQCVNTEKFGTAQWARMGVLSKFGGKLKRNDYRIIERSVHPDYNSSKFDNDIALLKLDSDVTFGPYVQPACLYAEDQIPEYAMDYAVITGWGDNGPGSRKSRLRYAILSFLEDKECQDYYANDDQLANGYDAETMVCAGNKKRPTGPCDGDGGGPIQIPDPENGCMWAQVGVISDLRCGKINPILFTKVLPFIPWIQQIVWPIK